MRAKPRERWRELSQGAAAEQCQRALRVYESLNKALGDQDHECAGRVADEVREIIDAPT